MDNLKKSVAYHLSKLKFFDNKFSSKLSEARFVEVFRKDKTSYGKDQKVFIQEAHASIKSLRDQIETDFETRKNIAKVNASTVINIKGKEFTIAEALLYRQYELPRLRSLLEEMRSSRLSAERAFKKAQTEFETKLTSSEYKDDPDMKKAYEEKYQPSVNNIDKQITDLAEYIEFFDETLDYLLSEKNATTTIDV